MSQRSPSTVVHAPWPSTTKRSAEGLWRWPGANSWASRYCTAAHSVDVAPYTEPP